MRPSEKVPWPDPPTSRTDVGSIPSSGEATGDPSRGAFLRNAYYLLKPFLPWSLRIALRRVRAHRRRRRFAETWPINPACGAPPAGWPGWPGGKRFAFVLSHDVEGQRGVDRCEQLANLEAELGFHSSFNFIPEGEYRVSEQLRVHLTKNGFEVGVHDLKHDGKLYLSKERFDRAALRINQYLRDWKAVGFRSGFMHHNLAWLRRLNVLYDASTFDSDPFEPQPEGAGTIFPFWVSGEDGSGYVELPYTLAQDITVFILFREQGFEIWKRKLDWVVSRGGMALVNVHPDYVSFSGQPGPQEFSAMIYRQFLEYVRSDYQDSCWMALPREVAEYAAAHRAGLWHHHVA